MCSEAISSSITCHLVLFCFPPSFHISLPFLPHSCFSRIESSINVLAIKPCIVSRVQGNLSEDTCELHFPGSLASCLLDGFGKVRGTNRRQKEKEKRKARVPSLSHFRDSSEVVATRFPWVFLALEWE